MKKALFLFAAVLIAVCAYAQHIDETRVPSPVKSSFQKKYPGIDNVKWEKEKGRYEASYKKNGQSFSALFGADGTFVESEIDIDVKELPGSAINYISEHFKGSKIKGASKITKANGETNYEAEVNGKDVVFDSNGKFLHAEDD